MKKEQNLNIRMSEELKEKIKKRSKDLGMPVSVYITTLVVKDLKEN